MARYFSWNFEHEPEPCWHVILRATIRAQLFQKQLMSDSIFDQNIRIFMKYLFNQF